MQRTTNNLKIADHRPPLSTIVVNEEGKLAYATPSLKKIARQMIKDFPIMCWYMLAGMVMLFSRSLWALYHRAETVTYIGEVLIYIFLLMVSVVVTLGILGFSYYLAKSKLQK